MAVGFRYGTFSPEHHVNHYLPPAGRAAKEADKFPSLYILRPLRNFYHNQRGGKEAGFSNGGGKTERATAEGYSRTIHLSERSFYSRSSASWGDSCEGMPNKQAHDFFRPAWRRVLFTTYWQVLAIGLNPIDWKAPYVNTLHRRMHGTNARWPRAFNFGIPSLPWINGRDLAGLVLQVPSENSRVRVGDIVLVPSTDYRDIRKAAFQEYAIATDFNAARIPSSTSIHASASLGVAFVASVLALGVSFGLDFSVLSKSPGPNLPRIIDQLDRNTIPADIQDECFVSESERPKCGDWVAIWGGKKYI